MKLSAFWDQQVEHWSLVFSVIGLRISFNPGLGCRVLHGGNLWKG